MKRTLALILSMLLALTLYVGAMAAESDFKHMPDYFAAGKYSGNDVDIVVPASIGGQPTPILYTDSIGSSAVRAMVSLTLSDGVTQLRDSNTYGANVLNKVVLPDTLEVIGRRNFYQADALAEITIPASVAYVGQECFSYCDILTKVTFTGLCPAFGANCFKDAAADLVIYVPDDQLDAYKALLAEGLNIQPSGKKAVAARAAVSESDFSFDASAGTITGYTGMVGCIEIPATIGGVQVKAIGQEALFKNPFVVAVTLPEGLETIELSAFAGAPALARVNFPSTLKVIGKYAFNGVKLDQLVLPEGLETIGDSAFTTAFGMNKIDEIVIPNTVTTIGQKAFNANKAARIVLGESVQNVGKEAFASSGALKEIVILNKTMITFAGDAFTKCTTEATLTLADGISQDVYNEYLTLMPMLFPTCTVIEPENMELGFPALDVMAGMPFFGTWNAVAGKDVMGEFTDAYPAVTATLNPDGTAAVQVDGEDKPSAWYVTDGYAILAPVVDGKADAAGAYGFANIDENGRLVIDFGYAAAICEQEGKIYTVPAVPEKPWPEFNLDNAKYFIGVWQTADGAMTLTLNDDGTAASAEMGEEAYALKWYADYGVAYVGPAMSELAKITFDGSGSIKMSMGGDEVILAPYVEKTLIEGADELLGEWLDDIGNKLTLTNDGAMTYTYASDGWVDEYKWDVIDGAAVVTEGKWADCPITLENDILTITNGEGIFQIFSRDGDLSAYYGEEDYELPEAAPIGAEGEPYFGTWTMDMGGMAMNLTLSQDGTCAMEMMGESEPGVWTMENGKAYVMGDELYIDEAGMLVLPSSGMTFTRGEGGASGEPAAISYVPSVADDFIGGWICKDDSSLQLLLLEGEANMIEGTECYTTTWTVVDGAAQFDGAKLYIQEDWTTGIVDMYGDLVEFERGYVEKPKASAAAPAASGDGDEMTDEELMALLGALAAMEDGEGASELPENLQPYVGTWHMVYIATGGLEGDLRTMGVSGKLELNADGTGRLSGAADDSGKWYDDEGQVRFGQAEAPLTLLDGGFLRYGSQLAGYMIFSQDESAVWTPASAAAPLPQIAAAAAPKAAASAGFASLEERLGKKFIATTFTSFGQTNPASALGAEYSVTFHENGTSDFMMGGVPMPGLNWGLKQVAVGLKQVDAFVISYGADYNFIPTDTGFDMDYFGTMTLHFELAQ